MNRLLLSLFFLGATVANASHAQEPAVPSADEAAIRQADEAYVQAFNKHDAKALADAWSPEAVYLNRTNGVEVVGRAAIAEQFATIFKDQPEVKLELNVKSVQFVSPNVAIEHGIGKTLAPHADPDETEYSAVFVKRDGKWLLDRVTDEAQEEAPPSHYEQLKPLEWMIGRWVDQDEQDRIETTCQWTKNRNFITRSFVVSTQDQIEMAGMQIIGWDPAAKQIRSWVFDSDGAFGEGVWSKKDNRWYIQSTGTLPDGSKSSATNIITFVDDNTFTWQSINRVADGELLPNVDEVIVARQPAAE